MASSSSAPQLQPCSALKKKDSIPSLRKKVSYNDALNVQYNLPVGQSWEDQQLLTFAELKCESYIYSYDSLPADFKSRHSKTKPLFTSEPPPYIGGVCEENYRKAYHKLIKGLNLPDTASRGTKSDVMSRNRTVMWKLWFESRTEWERRGKPFYNFDTVERATGYASEAEADPETEPMEVDNDDTSGNRNRNNDDDDIFVKVKVIKTEGDQTQTSTEEEEAMDEVYDEEEYEEYEEDQEDQGEEGQAGEEDNENPSGNHPSMDDTGDELPHRRATTTAQLLENKEFVSTQLEELANGHIWISPSFTPINRRPGSRFNH